MTEKKRIRILAAITASLLMAAWLTGCSAGKTESPVSSAGSKPESRLVSSSPVSSETSSAIEKRDDGLAYLRKNLSALTVCTEAENRLTGGTVLYACAQNEQQQLWEELDQIQTKSASFTDTEANLKFPLAIRAVYANGQYQPEDSSWEEDIVLPEYDLLIRAKGIPDVPYRLKISYVSKNALEPSVEPLFVGTLNEDQLLYLPSVQSDHDDHLYLQFDLTYGALTYRAYGYADGTVDEEQYVLVQYAGTWGIADGKACVTDALLFSDFDSRGATEKSVEMAKEFAAVWEKLPFRLQMFTFNDDGNTPFLSLDFITVRSKHNVADAQIRVTGTKSYLNTNPGRVRFAGTLSEGQVLYLQGGQPMFHILCKIDGVPHSLFFSDSSLEIINCETGTRYTASVSQG